MLEPTMKKNDRKAKVLIGLFSIIVFSVIVLLGRFHFTNLKLNFDAHIFAKANAIINTLVSILLIAALLAVKQKKYLLHKKIMLTAMILSILFLVCYITHHLLCGDTHFGDSNHDGILDEAEKIAVESIRMIYFILLAAHIFLAAIILPFILYTSYRGLTGDYEKHKKLARITWPIWLFVSITGPIVYLMISRYYY